jgi:hypothetical protein
MKATLAIFGILAFGSIPPNSLAAQKEKKTFRAPLEIRIQKFAKNSNGLARVVQIGRSRSGKPILAIELSKKHADKEKKPAVLLVAGLDGRRMQDSEVALKVAQGFIASKANSDQGRMLEAWTIWVIPCANPDGRFVKAEGNLGPIDEDRDGRIDEDGPEDLNGDGKALWMRKEDPEGSYLQDPKTGVMRKANPKKGESGRYKLWREGEDNDEDGDFNEDPKGGIIPDRNFPHLYPEHGKGAGPFVLSEPEAMSLVDFVVANPRIQLVLTLGAFDNLGGKIRKNTAPKNQPINGYDPRDEAVLKAFGKSIKRKSKQASDEWKGRFHAWVYAHAGRISLALRLGKEKASPKEKPTSKPSSQPSRKKGQSKGPVRSGENGSKDQRPEKITPWKPFKHPQLGEIEIGGKDPQEDSKISPQEQKKGVLLVTQLLVEAFRRACRLRIVKLETKALGDSVLEVRAIVRNEGKNPSRTAIADRLRSPRLPRLEFVRFSKEKPLSSIRWGKKEAEASLLTGKPFVFIPSRLLFGETSEFRWIIKKPQPGTLGIRIAQEGLVFDIKEVK